MTHSPQRKSLRGSLKHYARPELIEQEDDAWKTVASEQYKNLSLSAPLENLAMPEISRFYGIVIKIFFADHPPPHFHVIYGEYNALINIETLEIIEGDLPNRAVKIATEWATIYQPELFRMWQTQEFQKLPPLP